MLSTDKLKNKEVINIADGRSLGFICDIEVNLASGTIDGIVIPAEPGAFHFFGSKEEDTVIKWDRIGPSATTWSWWMLDNGFGDIAGFLR